MIATIGILSILAIILGVWAMVVWALWDAGLWPAALLVIAFWVFMGMLAWPT